MAQQVWHTKVTITVECNIWNITYTYECSAIKTTPSHTHLYTHKLHCPMWKERKSESWVGRVSLCVWSTRKRGGQRIWHLGSDNWLKVTLASGLLKADVIQLQNFLHPWICVGTKKKAISWCVHMKSVRQCNKDKVMHEQWSHTAELESQVCHWLAVLVWTSYLTSLCFLSPVN